MYEWLPKLFDHGYCCWLATRCHVTIWPLSLLLHTRQWTRDFDFLAEIVHSEECLHILLVGINLIAYRTLLVYNCYDFFWIWLKFYCDCPFKLATVLLIVLLQNGGCLLVLSHQPKLSLKFFSQTSLRFWANFKSIKRKYRVSSARNYWHQIKRADFRYFTRAF